MLPEATGIFKFDEDPGRIPINRIAPGVVPADVELYLYGLVCRVVAGGSYILNQHVVGVGSKSEQQSAYEHPFTFHDGLFYSFDFKLGIIWIGVSPEETAHKQTGDLRYMKWSRKGLAKAELWGIKKIQNDRGVKKTYSHFK